MVGPRLSSWAGGCPPASRQPLVPAAGKQRPVPSEGWDTIVRSHAQAVGEKDPELAARIGRGQGNGLAQVGSNERSVRPSSLGSLSRVPPLATLAATAVG